MIKIIDKKNCCGCGACVASCPQKCIQMIEDDEGFLYPKVDESKCIKCGICEKVCPIIQYTNQNQQQPKCVLAYSKDNAIREKSSSGGIFSEIANYILKNKGVVYGAAVTENLQVEHIRITREEELYQLRGSKYVQSNLKNIFLQIEKDLKNDIEVLFTGTPCQIAGIKKFLKKEYKNLYTCDIICHGVPSPKVFTIYIKELEKKYASQVKEIYFRNKDTGWNNFRIKIVFENGKIYSCEANKDPFMKSFLQNANLRPSCYQCNFSTIPRLADITLGDYWGVNIVHPELKDDKGISMITINNDRGERVLQKIKDKIFIEENEDISNFIKFNPCICASVKPHKNRDEFFKDVESLQMEELEKKYFTEKITIKWVLRKLKRLAVKIIKK